MGSVPVNDNPPKWRFVYGYVDYSGCYQLGFEWALHKDWNDPATFGYHIYDHAWVVHWRWQFMWPLRSVWLRKH